MSGFYGSKGAVQFKENDHVQCRYVKTGSADYRMQYTLYVTDNHSALYLEFIGYVSSQIKGWNQKWPLLMTLPMRHLGSLCFRSPQLWPLQGQRSSLLMRQTSSHMAQVPLNFKLSCCLAVRCFMPRRGVSILARVLLLIISVIPEPALCLKSAGNKYRTVAIGLQHP